AAASVSHVGAPRANPHPRVQFQLEESVCGCWTHVAEFLFPAVRWCGQGSAGHRFSAGARAAHSQAAAFGLGPLAGPPQPSRARLYRPARRQNPGRVSSRLRSRTESGSDDVATMYGRRIFYPEGENCLAEGQRNEGIESIGSPKRRSSAQAHSSNNERLQGTLRTLETPEFERLESSRHQSIPSLP